MSTAATTVAGRTDPCDMRTMANDPGTGRADRDLVAGLGKGLAIIELFNETRRRLAISEAAALAGLTRAAARRYLLSLVHLGYAEFDGKYFSLTPRVMRLGHAYLAATSLPRLLQPYLDRIAAEAGDPCIAGVLDGIDVVCIAQAAPPRMVFRSLAVGSRLAAYNTAIGRVLMAYASPEWLEDYWRRVRPEPRTAKSIIAREALLRELARVQDDGYAIVDEEVEPGLRTLAVPLRNTAAVVIAAVNVSVHASRIAVADMPRVLLALLAPAQEALKQLP
jgi:IclR family transcriptional regulator, pca regulon regulatory protein